MQTLVDQIRAEQHMYKQKELILQVKELTPEMEKLLYELMKKGETWATPAAAAARMIMELDEGIDLKAFAKTLAPLLDKKPLFQTPLARQLLRSSNKERSCELLLLLMEDYWIAQAVVREMRDYGRDDKALIDAAVALLPEVEKVDRPAVGEMKHWLKGLGVKFKKEKEVTRKTEEKKAAVKKQKKETAPKEPTAKDLKKQKKEAAKQFQAHIRAGLSQAGPLDRGQHYPYEKLVQEYRDMDPEKRPEFSRVLAEFITDGDVFVRSSVIRFFQMEPSADDVGNLANGFLSHMELFEDVEDPIMGATNDLLGELLRAIVNKRTRFAGNPILLMALRQMTLTERASTIVAGMLYEDRAWMLENAKKILHASPDVFETYLLNLPLQELRVKDGALETFLQDAQEVLPVKEMEEKARARFGHNPELLERVLNALK